MFAISLRVSPWRPFQPSLMFVRPAVEHLKSASSGASLKRALALALQANIKLGWKGLPGTKKTLDFYENS